ncbi:hypothetical protein SDC9_200860 [bioreactor metagenome]|uniref:Uncharacterized protein n=1 Tax=bioreactor metagenome TaxID=1076179 RepID=A0A645IQ31_9ZZZZ
MLVGAHINLFHVCGGWRDLVVVGIEIAVSIVEEVEFTADAVHFVSIAEETANRHVMNHADGHEFTRRLDIGSDLSAHFRQEKRSQPPLPSDEFRPERVEFHDFHVGLVAHQCRKRMFSIIITVQP